MFGKSSSQVSVFVMMSSVSINLASWLTCVDQANSDKELKEWIGLIDISQRDLDGRVV